MTFPITVDSVPTNPGGTGSTIVPALSAHTFNDIIEIWIGKTGNVAWNAPTGWTRRHQGIVGTSSNGIVGTLIYRLVLPSDVLPLPDPTCNLGATVTRGAIALTRRGADISGVYTSPQWGATGILTGTANPVRPPSITTLTPDALVHHYYCQRAATNAPDPSTYTQNEEIIISGTLVINVSEKNVASIGTVLSNQDASPTSGARWAAAITAAPIALPELIGRPYGRFGQRQMEQLLVT